MPYTLILFHALHSGPAGLTDSRVHWYNVLDASLLIDYFVLCIVWIYCGVDACVDVISLHSLWTTLFIFILWSLSYVCLNLFRLRHKPVL